MLFFILFYVNKICFICDFFMFSAYYLVFPQNLPLIEYYKKYDSRSPLMNMPHTIASNAPPDDNVGDVTPIGSFALIEGNNFPQEIDKISNIVQRLPNYSYIKKNNLKIQTINNIPTGIIKI